jgi:two-component system nitrate/nitrite sensor histidine kinase NarX
MERLSMRQSLRNLLFLIIVGFLSVITLSMVFNQLIIASRAEHEEVLSTAYDHRNTAQMIFIEVSSADDNTPDLSAPIEKFNQGLKNLQGFDKKPWSMGDLVGQPMIIHANYGSDLAKISDSWSKFLVNWAAFQKLSPTDPLYVSSRLDVMNSLAVLIKQVDAFSDTLEGLEAAQDMNQSKGQFAFFGLGLVLLAWGGYVIIMRVIRPLGYLDTAVRQIGQGELDLPIRVTADDELGRLAHSFENMRFEIAASQKLLEARVDERTRVLTAAFEFNQEIIKQTHLNNITALVSQRARDLMHARSASLCLIAEDISKFDPKTGRRKPTTGSLIRKDSNAPSVNTVQPAVYHNHPEDPDMVLFSTPLQIGGLNIGSLCVIRDKGEPFSELDIHTLKLLANSTAVVIANIRLIESERSETELNATLTERQRIASELHDEAAQTLSLLNLKVTELDSFTTTEKGTVSSSALPQFNALIEKAQSQMRMAFSGLSAPVVARGGDLRSDLEHYLAEFERSSGIVVDLLVDDFSNLNIPLLVQKQVAYIYREAITNVKRYSQAKNVKVRLQNVDNGIHVAVNDDGVGFDPNISRSDHHFGLSVMQMRTERIGGALIIETAPGKGTRVAAFIPLTSEIPTVLQKRE